MSFAEHLRRAGLTDRDDVEVGLAADGRELTVEGYARQPTREWGVDGGVASLVVTFGPLSATPISEGLLFVGGELVDRKPIGLTRVADGMLFDLEVTARVGDG